jgi:hypothetical protein
MLERRKIFVVAGGRVSDVYDDIELRSQMQKLPESSALVDHASMLSDGSGVTDDFLLQHVVPNICTRFPAEVARCWRNHFSDSLFQ